MAMTERNPSVVVTSDETLRDVVERVRGAASGGRTVHLVVPIDSSLLLTANEFRALKAAIDDDRLSVVMRTSDPLRLQLGERLGIRTEPLPRQRPQPLLLTPPPPPLAPSPELPLHDIDTVAERPFVSESLAQSDPASRWPLPGEPVRSEDDSSDGKLDELAETDHDSALLNPPRRWLPVAALLVFLVTGTFLVMQFVIPRAVVRIVPKAAPVEASLLFDMTADGQPQNGQAAFALAPRTRELEVTWEGEAPVTGVRKEPDGVAAGPIELRNASPEPLTVDAGTVATTEDGTEFAFVDAVTVPPMDPASGEPGAATGSVRAVNPGSTGNVAYGEVGGRLPNGVYYSNRMEPTSGGTDKEFPVVAQEDLDAMTASAIDAADELAADALAASENAGDEVLLATRITNQKHAFDHTPGEDAETLTLRSTMTIEATTYDKAEVKSRFESVLTARLASEAPDGFAVDQDEIVFGPAMEISREGENVRLEVAANAEARTELDASERQALVARLAGASPEDAERILSQVIDIEAFTVEYSPGWFPARMPNNASRIEFEVAP